MMPNPPSTWYTVSPEWGWFIVFYFFIGGLAGGACIAAAMLDLAGSESDRAIIRRAYLVGLVGVAISGALLSLDLGRPLRFWHMIIQSNTGRPMFKPWSPMSFGSWILLSFGLFAFLASLVAWRDEPPLAERLPSALRRLLARRPVRVLAAIGVGITGFGLAGYTGVLLAVTNRPIWAESPWLGILFLVSGVSTGLAVLMLLGARAAPPTTLDWLSQFDRGALALELIVLIVFVVSLGAAARAFAGAWGVVLAVTAVVGVLWPLILEGRRAHSAQLRSRAATLVLIGGLLLRVTIIFASSAIHTVGTEVVRR
jgi:formate-dependent nitrite reductase membrane component NrfD